jgi:hypothetical protein
MELFATKDQSANTLARVLIEGILCRFGCPHTMLSDRGNNLMSKIVQKMCQLMATKRLYTTSFKPSTNGRSERMNASVVSILKVYCNEHQDDWDDLLPFCQFAFNTSKNEATSETPYSILFGREAALPLDAMMFKTTSTAVSAKDYRALVIDRLAELQKNSHLQTVKAQRKMAARYPPMGSAPQYTPGQKVWIMHAAVPKGLHKKLYCPWKGPFVVTHRLSPLNYVVHPLGGHALRTVHIEKMKPYKEGLPLTLQQAPDEFEAEEPDEPDVSDERDDDEGGEEQEEEQQTQTAARAPPADTHTHPSAGTQEGTANAGERPTVPTHVTTTNKHTRARTGAAQTSKGPQPPATAQEKKRKRSEEPPLLQRPPALWRPAPS